MGLWRFQSLRTSSSHGEAAFKVSSGSGPSAPPPFSSLGFSPTAGSPFKEESLENQLDDEPPTFESAQSSGARPIPSLVESETKAALPHDTKQESSGSKDVDDGEPPPPYSEGSSPLDSFTYIMAASGGAQSIITQVSQGAGAPLNALGGEERSLRGATEKSQAPS